MRVWSNMSAIISDGTLYPDRLEDRRMFGFDVHVGCCVACGRRVQGRSAARSGAPRADLLDTAGATRVRRIAPPQSGQAVGSGAA